MRIPPQRAGNHLDSVNPLNYKLSARTNSFLTAKSVRNWGLPFGIACQNLICSLYALGSRLLTSHSAILHRDRRLCVCGLLGLEPSVCLDRQPALAFSVERSSLLSSKADYIIITIDHQNHKSNRNIGSLLTLFATRTVESFAHLAMSNSSHSSILGGVARDCCLTAL